MKRLNYLAIPMVVLLTACSSVGGIDNPLASDSTPGTDEATSSVIPGDLDITAAAEKLGVSADDLTSALGEPPVDMAAAAEKLGISETALMDALKP